MSAVAPWQASLQSALLQPHPAPAGLLSPRGDTQFRVYLNAYRARLRGALRDNYEGLPQLMGDDAFEALANAYIDAHPSTHYSIRWFGEQLSTFMAAHSELVPHPALRDFATMEWALRLAFDAQDAATLSAADLAALPPEDWPSLQLALHPSVQLLDLQWAVGPVWHDLQSGSDDVAEPQALAHSMLVWRWGLNTQWMSLTPAQHCFVHGLQTGAPFGTLCEALAQVVGEADAAQTAVAVLRELLARGAICAILN